LKVGNKMQAGSGGRVTELTARPLLNLFYPELSGIVQLYRVNTAAGVNRWSNCPSFQAMASRSVC